MTAWPGLGRVGLWTRQLDAQPGRVAEETVAELEELGYRTLWIPEAVHREVLSHATMLLAATDALTVATGIARVHARSPESAALAQLMLSERFPGRFVLGLGVSHARVIEGFHRQAYGPPLATMAAYLDAIDAVVALPRPAPPTAAPRRVLAALGERMLTLARDRSDGAHTYMAPVEHTAWARSVLGPDRLIAVAIKAVLGRRDEAAMDIARASVAGPVRMPAYRDNLARLGFREADLGRDPSDRLVDALVAVGDEGTVIALARAHLDAGADHVCVEVLTGDDTSLPLSAWRALAPALAEA